ALNHFDPHLKLMSTLDRSAREERTLHVKGAPEAVLARCDTALSAAGTVIELDDSLKRLLDRQVTRFSSEGRRVIAIAQRAVGTETVPRDRAELERELTLLGIVAIEDPPRPEVADAVASCHG